MVSAMGSTGGQSTKLEGYRLMDRRFFDLNIQRVLEHWTVSEALRELIANALDEQALTGTAEPEILEDAVRAHTLHLCYG